MTKVKHYIREFRRCANAIYAFAAGYKLGERYAVGRLEAKQAKSIDPEAWQLGYDLSTKRYKPYESKR